ncbi:LOW QUALITY PROTEIN: hypothetical protein HID58_044178 [Brassica napus]|uniref:Uncharacterized protein n=1 Tax=Brassica napus TaxID=3708 RepID=A0ABQ8BKA6_BRANA|nr:LOW QUALITY PROTEIN: hypothetical protein HID58_044178 [Brassica napus]
MAGVAGRHTGIENSTSGVRQHHNNLADKIMPLLAPSIPPGFEPLSSVVASKVFEQMIIYMNCADSEERLLREAKMKKMLNELSHDPIAQRSCLRLEIAPRVSTDGHAGRGKIFDFSRVQADQLYDITKLSSKVHATRRNHTSASLTERDQLKKIEETSVSADHRLASTLHQSNLQLDENLLSSKELADGVVKPNSR